VAPVQERLKGLSLRSMAETADGALWLGSTNRLLRLAGRTLGKHRRGMHLTAHHGREEGMYLSILSGMDLDGACVYARKVRRELMSLKGLPEMPKVSVGIVAYDMSMNSPRDLIEQAERALVKATDNGSKILVVAHLQTAGVD
jgi:PleD family two-component response regulator